MPLTSATLATDYLIWDGTETVTVWPSPRNNLVYFPVTYAKGRALNHSDLLQDNGAYTAEDRVWLLPTATSQALTDAFPLRRGFVIEDNTGAEWTVLSLTLGKWENTWRLVCRNLVLTADLRDTVTIKRPTVTIGDGGEPSLDWTTATEVVTDLAAKVKVTRRSPEDINAAEGVTSEYTVVLASSVDLQEHDRILWSGKALQWTEIHNEGRLDELMAVTCRYAG